MLFLEKKETNNKKENKNKQKDGRQERKVRGGQERTERG